MTSYEEIVKEMAEKFERNLPGAVVRARGMKGVEEVNEQIRGFTPDLTVESENRSIILAVVDIETAFDEDTERKLRAFSSVPDREFHIAVPEGKGEKLKQEAERKGYSVDVIWQGREIPADQKQGINAPRLYIMGEFWVRRERTNMKHKLSFDFSPNLIRLLGEQLIHDKKIALSEIVKNSYDADASRVVVEIGNGISIFDDGCGMDLETIKDVWLKPGVSSKKNKPTEKYGRIPIGEKGVGRLGCHKLGDEIELFTKTEKGRSIRLKIEWDKITREKSLKDLMPIEVTETENNSWLEKDKSGTKMIIRKLKENWTDPEIENVSNDLLFLIDPFSEKQNFDVEIRNKEKLIPSNLREKAEEIKKNSFYEFEIVFEKGLLKKFEYRFKDLKGLEKVESRKITLKKNKNFIKKMLGGKRKKLDVDKEIERYQESEIGEVKFSGFIYDLDTILWRDHIFYGTKKQERKKISGFLKEVGGIRVYRDGFRVFNYGEIGNDIVSLDLKRVNAPTGKISSNQILAAIDLDRSRSRGLIEKTDREGFINNKHLKFLQEMLDEAINLITDLRLEDKTKIRRLYLEKPEDRASIELRINKIKEDIDKSKLEDEKKEKIKKNLDSFSKEFDKMKDIFMTASNTGLNLSIVVHELEKLLNSLSRFVKNKEWDKVSKICSDLKETIEIYKNTIRLDKNKSLTNVEEIIDIACFNFQARFEHHGISLEKKIEDKKINVKKNLVIGILNNLFDNSVYWLDYQGVKDKKILVRSYKKNNQTHIVVADNGKGFTIGFEEAKQPFITGRRDESSMGIGLYLAEQVMAAHEGAVKQGNFDEEDLPKDFKEGAIVKLLFGESKDV